MFIDLLYLHINRKGQAKIYALLYIFFGKRKTPFKSNHFAFCTLVRFKIYYIFNTAIIAIAFKNFSTFLKV